MEQFLLDSNEIYSRTPFHFKPLPPPTNVDGKISLTNAFAQMISGSFSKGPHLCFFAQPHVTPCHHYKKNPFGALSIPSCCRHPLPAKSSAAEVQLHTED